MDAGNVAISVPEARKDPRLRSFALRRISVAVGPRLVRLVVPEAAEYRRRGAWVSEAARTEPPYWVRVWPSAVVLARVLGDSALLPAPSVLDLGCGLGLPGIVASLRGAEVHFVDRCEHALAFATWNAMRHRRDGARVSGQCLDWCRDCIDERFDVLVLADVSYHRSQHDGLLRQVEAALGPGGIVLHADPHREESTRFLERLGRSMDVWRASRAVRWDDSTTEVRLSVGCRDQERLARWRSVLECRFASVGRIAGAGADVAGEPAS